MFCKPIILSLLNYSTETIKGTEGRTLDSPVLEYWECHKWFQFIAY
jgi:hypothetical protein